MQLTMRQFQQNVDGFSDEVFLVREDGRIAWVNALVAADLGYSLEDLVGRSLFEIAPSSAELFKARLAAGEAASSSPSWLTTSRARAFPSRRRCVGSS
jgi:PAS domain S-box-containing protein